MRHRGWTIYDTFLKNLPKRYWFRGLCPKFISVLLMLILIRQPIIALNESYIFARHTFFRLHHFGTFFRRPKWQSPFNSWFGSLPISWYLWLSWQFFYENVSQFTCDSPKPHSFTLSLFFCSTCRQRGWTTSSTGFLSWLGCPFALRRHFLTF